ncbi:bifunctional [glutamine synthetase] adenylyltransferase/[glutamine synthetase]-adenylyl-L-tyrosine phosphorylase [Nocardioides aequoreus]|uniref:bifunctional [glutamine synthetase] adenylyltransferase/[glutamine synthetase]-adenylyl-L-tyrosine phosphorylase n=1 Tax=Nocardioides aequoreus TaxID=397278 RepID=UPI0006920A0A|nr:bifunctional [glutamine synthetase] adenylyltransferase/[glutamine synthetase]-adenylyl-L-tyrosine phosphorylase [Nocardioides aequoreus]
MAAPTDSATGPPLGSLARLGFHDPDRAAAQLARLGDVVTPLAPLLGRSADPDQALDGLVALAEAATDREQLLLEVADDEGTSMRLLSVLGGSTALADHLRRHPGHWRELCDPTIGSTRPTRAAMRRWLMEAVGADPAEAAPVAGVDPAEACDALRVEYRRQLLRLAARDLAHALGIDDVAAELSDLALGTLDAALAVARAMHPDAGRACRLAVVALGKCGGHELNYVSDVDVVFVAEAPLAEASQEQPTEEHEALRAATQLASAMMRVCGDHTREGTIWPVDANLRPEGRSGPLVRSLESHRGYYERWAKTWEFQALLKARPAAGDLALGEEYLEMVGPLVWSAVERDGFVEEVQAMRRRVVDHIPARESERQLKLGPGGLRDVEFAVQLLQLVHGRTDEAIRSPTTLSALARLTERGYVGRDDGRALHEAYAFLRTMEHRLQLHQLRRTHVVPTDEVSLRRLGRSMGFRRDPVAELDDRWHYHQREVRRLHEKLFYRPLLSAVARISGDEAQLSPESAKQRLAALGYLDPTAALRHLQALTSGVRRSAQIQRQLLPAMLGWFGDTPDPDAGLFGFRQLSEALGGTPWYLRLLRDEGEVAQRTAQVLGTSRYATDLLRREPQAVALLAEDKLAPLSREAVLTEMRAAAGRRDELADAVRAVRAVRRRELLRISVADLCVPFGVEEVGYALTDVATATLQSTLERVTRAVAETRGAEPPTRLAIVAMGRYGGHELGYGSDADVMFVHDPLPGADAQEAATFARTVVNELRRLLSEAGKDPALEVDADLRPEGRQGPMVRTLASYAAYYATWSAVWEAQALLRAKAVAGDPDLCRRFTELVDPLRFAPDGLSADDTVEIRRIKARVDAERLPRGADPATHFKLGRGGLADVEWTVQLLQMQHAGEVPGLRTTKTLEALEAAVAADLLDRDDADALAQAWRFASRARNATVQVRGKAADQLPRDARERAAVAAVLQYPPDATEAMVNDYLRTARRARTVVDRVFWGDLE